MTSHGNIAEADTILEDLVRKQKLPGIAVGFLRNGQLVYEKAFGFSDIEKEKRAVPETIFRIASVSKPIAATTLARFVERGIIDLDANFYDYVPYFPKKEYDFSIRQLAGHTAGIRSYRGKEFALNKPYTIRESLVFFQDDPLIFKPGTSFHYNSLDWVLISLAMEEVSGKPFEVIVKEEVLDPLGMKHTSAEDPSETIVNKAEFYTAYAGGFRKAIAVNNRYKLAGGGFLSTTSDLLKLGQSYLDKSLLSPETGGDFLSSQIVDGKPTYYGLGWEVSSDHQGRHTLGHKGSNVGAYSKFYIYPEQEAVLAILINCTNPKLEGELELLTDQLLTVAS